MIAPPAVIPVNRLDRAKGRLAGLLTAAERRELTLLTLATVVEAVAAGGLEPCILTAEPTIAESPPAGARVVQETPLRPGLNAQLECALAALPAALILHADLPLATGTAIDALLRATPPGPSAALVQSRDGGTNAMLLTVTGRFPLAYGPASFARHLAAARAAGLVAVEHRDPDLALDIDTPDDIVALLATRAGRETPAGRYLIAVGVADRLTGRST